MRRPLASVFAPMLPLFLQPYRFHCLLNARSWLSDWEGRAVVPIWHRRRCRGRWTPDNFETLQCQGFRVSMLLSFVHFSIFFASLLLFLSPQNAPLQPPRVSSRRESFYRAVLSLDGLVYPFRSEVRPGVGLWEFGVARRNTKTNDQCYSQDHAAVTRPRPRPMPRPANEK